MRKKIKVFVLLLITIFIVGCTDVEDASMIDEEAYPQEEAATDTNQDAEKEEADSTAGDDLEEDTSINTEDEPSIEETSPETNDDQFEGYELIEVDGGDLSGDRESNVVVDIGFGDREYWAFTNDHGQLVRVVADEIILQNDSNEPVLSSGRYFSDEAKVPGVESDVLDEGHVIADSLGGVSNAYNITPQESALNRHGDQSYMENAISKADGATNFEAVISYSDTNTQIPSKYQYSYTINGNEVIDTFENVNPDEVNESLGLTDSDESTEPDVSNSEEQGDVSSIDTNGNGQVTIQEAKDAGFSMPITDDHWLYPYMRDNDGDGMVGE
ncbi:DNA/RNA non-specific endonuclease [Halobacillus litoralis]|uniref:DNA/RNA non-specific endonuclease n=1 Tax=Halobacillus litoralis TaxID=45668 RepID=UPI001927CC09|nr:DNA/RNA non-specific endonuclease [Halobacillus litoralis]